MHAVAHLVGDECALDLLNNLFPGRKIDKCESARGTLEPVKMLVQFENAAVVKAQAFPNGVAPLHRRIEGAYSGFVAVHELAVDVDDQVAVLGIKFLQHRTMNMSKESKENRKTN